MKKHTARLVALSALLMVQTGASQAAWSPTVLRAPAAYQRQPDTKPWILYVSDPNRFCRDGGLTTRRGWTIYACSGKIKGSGQCAIILPKHGTAAYKAKLLRHEQAHCNGWKHRD